jgi:glycosyltransferase involved in cell wall biosynthesis
VFTGFRYNRAMTYPDAATRFCLIGPTYPYRGGIAHYTTLLARTLRADPRREVLLISFSQQYPGWLFPGRSDRDPSQRPLQSDAEFILHPLNPLSWRRTLRRIRAWQPDAIVIPWWHPYFAPAWSVLGRAVKRLPGRPRLIFICHNVLPHEQGRCGRFLLPPTLRLTLGPADGHIVHAHSDARILRQIVPGADPIVTPLPTYAALGNAATATLPEIPVALPNDRPLLLFCGFVRPYKGLDVLLDALPLALARRPLHLLVAGEFWQGADAARAQIARLGLADNVTLLDAYLPDELLAACIDRADVVVLPYRSATQSAVVQTAFGRGKPVITTDVGGLADAVANGRTGLVVPPEDPSALAAAIERFFAENLGPQMRANIGVENGRFAWQRLVDQLVKLATEEDNHG